MKYLSKVAIFSLSMAFVLGVGGCSADLEKVKELVDDNASDVVTPITEVSTITGRAVDGYLKFSTVCLDLSGDGLCDPSTEPFTLTASDGSFTLNLSRTHLDSPNYKKAQLVVFGGQDADRPGEDFIGKLKAPNDGSGLVNVTPVTTLVSAYIQNKALSEVSISEITAAKQKVAAALGITQEQVGADPRGTNDSKLINATLQLQYAVNSMVKAANSTSTTSEIADKIFNAFATGLVNITSNADVASGVESIIDNADSAKLSSIDPNLINAKVIAKSAASNVNSVMGVEGVDFSNSVVLNEALSKVVVYQNKVVQKLPSTDYNTIDATEFDFSDDVINFEDESAIIYLSDLGVDVAASDFNVSAYSGKVTLDKDLEELAQVLQNDTAIVSIIETEIQTNQDEADKQISDASDAIASADAEEKMAQVEGDVTALLATTKSATVSDAKKLVTQIRESVDSFVDIDAINVEDNTSTILGGQVSLITSKIQPAIENIADDFNASATALESSLKAFGDSLQTSFESVIGSETTMGSIETRLQAIKDAIGDRNETENWSVTAGSDTLSHTYAKTGNIVTQTYTFNGSTLRMVYNEVDDGPPLSLSKTGNLEFAGEDYNLSISSLYFIDNKAKIKASGRIDGINNSSMNLSELKFAFDFDAANNDTPHMINNIEASFDGSIVSAGRTLNGKLVVSESKIENNKIHGQYIGAAGEPSFEGNATAYISLDDVKSATYDSEHNWVDPNSLLMVTYDDGSRSFVKYFKELYDYNTASYYYSLRTQNGKNLRCNTAYDYGYDYYSYSVDCEGGSVQAYYGDNKVITVTANSKDYVVHGAWTNYDYYSGKNRPEIELVNNDNIYFDGLTLVMDGDPVTISNISMRDAQSMDDVDLDMSFSGTLTHGSKVITTTNGLKQLGTSSERTLYAENLSIEDGNNFVKIASMSATASKEGFFGDDNYYDGYNMFESYTINYDSYNDPYYNQNSGPEFLSVELDDLKISITDIDGDTLTIDADVAFNMDSLDTQNISFNGAYGYANTNFTGVVNANINDTTNTYSFSLYGDVIANGYEPFSVTVAGSSIRDVINAYGLFKRGSGVDEYKLGVYLNGSYDTNTSEQTIEMNMADSNGVMAIHTESWIDMYISYDDGLGTCYVVYGDDYLNEVMMDCTQAYALDGSDTPFSLTLTNKDDTSLAEIGEAATGNSWEILYSDDTSETLF